jgi:hypothetical protein
VVGVSHSSFYWTMDDTTVIIEPNSIAFHTTEYIQTVIDGNNNNNLVNNKRRNRIWKLWKSFRRRIHLDDDEDGDEAAPPTPMWLHDPSDGLCLGPTATFSECGDATLWYISIQHDLPPLNKLQLLSGIPISAEDSDHTPTTIPPTNTRIGLMFRVMDQNYDMAVRTSKNSDHTATTNPKTRRRRQRTNNDHNHNENHYNSPECLDANPTNSTVHVRQCRNRGGYIWEKQQIRSSVWVVNTHGILQSVATSVFVTTNNNNKKKNRKKALNRITNDNMHNTALCLSRNGTNAILTDCNVQNNPVRFLFLRYRAIPNSSSPNSVRLKSASKSEHLRQQSDNNNIQQQTQSDGSTNESTPTSTPTNLNQDIQPKSDTLSNLPTYRDLAHNHADEPLMHPELKIATRLIFDDPSRKRNSDDYDHNNINKNSFKASSFAVALYNTNPILFATTSTTLTKDNMLRHVSNINSPIKPSMIHSSSNDVTNMKASKIRRMQTHPYLKEAKDGIWTDPQTNIEYSTDLCHYLGRNRQQHGRHTLTGFGIYRKGYVIKVYGIAFYVSKQDVLMDPILEPYVTMTAEELRLRPDFYEILRKMRNSIEKSNDSAGYFDRTIMLKTNMQLSTETMRSSLEADWSYLTDEAKRTLVGASMQEQIADDAMLEFIQSAENPSRCSCSQIAPPEYNANPDCCARGTELVFTWTKTNELEVRLNGRLMDVFPRPDIAEGIFYEYLRYDNPISPEFLDHVVDGFPFILGPLAQVRGVNMGQGSFSKGATNTNDIFTAMMDFRESIISQTLEISEIAKQNVFDAAEHAGNMVRILGDTAVDFAKESDRRRDLMVKHTVAAPEVLMKLLARDEETIQYFTRWISGQSEPPVPVDDDSDKPIILTPRGPRGRTFGYPLSRWFGEDVYYSPDEIEPMMIHPTINKAILTLVHLYLLLLFIVSFPGSYTTRTKLLHRKYSVREPVDDSESEISDENNSIARVIEDEAKPIHECKEKVKYQCPRKMLPNRHNIFPRPCISIRATNSVDIYANGSDSGLKKKSLSYFL